MAEWHKAIAALERRIMRAVEALPFRMLAWSLSSKSSAVGAEDEVETGDGDDSQRPARRIEPFGVRSRVPARVRTLQIRIGSSNTLILGVASTNGYGPTDLDDGDSALYNAKAAEVRCKGDDVVVNGGTKDVARVDDTLTSSTALATWAAKVEAALSAATSPLAPADIFSANVTADGLLGKIATGAANFKG